jgi:hypothetical protein
VSVDINGYYNIYNDFIGNLNGLRLIMAQHRTIRQLILVGASKDMDPEFDLQ